MVCTVGPKQTTPTSQSNLGDKYIYIPFLKLDCEGFESSGISAMFRCFIQMLRMVCVVLAHDAHILIRKCKYQSNRIFELHMPHISLTRKMSGLPIFLLPSALRDPHQIVVSHLVLQDPQDTPQKTTRMDTNIYKASPPSGYTLPRLVPPPQKYDPMERGPAAQPHQHRSAPKHLNFQRTTIN